MKMKSGESGRSGGRHRSLARGDCCSWYLSLDLEFSLTLSLSLSLSHQGGALKFSVVLILSQKPSDSLSNSLQFSSLSSRKGSSILLLESSMFLILFFCEWVCRLSLD